MKMGQFQQQATLIALLLSGLGVVQPGQAQEKPMDYTLSSEGIAAFDGLVQEAESVAAQALRRRFAEDASLSHGSVQVMGERDGAIAPILSITVNRTGWQNHPNIRTWAHYFYNSTVLLSFNRPQESQPSKETPVASLSDAFNEPPEGL